MSKPIDDGKQSKGGDNFSCFETKTCRECGKEKNKLLDFSPRAIRCKECSCIFNQRYRRKREGAKLPVEQFRLVRRNPS